MGLKKIFPAKDGQSKTLRIIILIVAGLIVFLLVFRFGVALGYRKAMFSYRWGENYHRNFGGPRGGFLKEFFSDRMDAIESHGTFGQIIKIDSNTIIVKGRNNVEKIIIVENDTTITRFRKTVELSDLKIDDYVVIIGNPNDTGQIKAKFIRVLPPPPSGPRRP
ncbi:MAG: hypothetical protein UX98_C0018G0004 [Parcubacteria group bacterium GW2011_GWA2_47_26]|nr:MAG: hypothetical protein UX98_C0018G0004 [Parcubacteria group bacterium GW2011_GWA2_47_26]